MDSGNSGSLQSSSGADEEYDSRAANSVSVFISGGPISNSSPPPQPFFDPFSNYLQLHQNLNGSLFNSGPAWPRTTTTTNPRSGPYPVSHDNIMNSMLPSSSCFMPSSQTPTAAGVDKSSCIPTLAPPLHNQNHSPAAARNPKKRSRASRRAPTTVLTTDTTNFRAMVQEFTGIPAPPFSSSSFPRSRLDFFSTRSNPLDAAQPPPYLRRPFPQKVQPQHSLLSSAALDAIPASSPTSNNIISHVSSTSAAVAAAASGLAPSINYQLEIAQNSNIFNIQNPHLSSLLQSNHKFPFSTSPVIASKPSNSFEILSNTNPHTEQFSLGPGNHVSETLTGLPNLIPSDQIELQNDHNNNSESNNAARWNDNHVSGEGNKDDGVNLRSLNGEYIFPRSTMNSKMTFPASSTSNFYGGKAPENVAGRGEGMVESWICSSE